MAKGAESKNVITNKIMEIFPESFIYDKVLIIPMCENSEEIQIKVALTCAKTNVERGGAPAVVGAVPTAAVTVNQPVEPTAEEKKTLSEMMQMLGLG